MTVDRINDTINTEQPTEAESGSRPWVRWLVILTVVQLIIAVLVTIAGGLFGSESVEADGAQTAVTVTTAADVNRPTATTVPTPSGTTIPASADDADGSINDVPVSSGLVPTTSPTPVPVEPTPVTLDLVEDEGLDATGSCWFLSGPADDAYFFLSLDNDGLLFIDGEPVHVDAEDEIGNQIPTAYLGDGWSVALEDLGPPTSAGYESAIRTATLAVETIEQSDGYTLDGDLFCTI